MFSAGKVQVRTALLGDRDLHDGEPIEMKTTRHFEQSPKSRIRNFTFEAKTRLVETETQ